MRFSRFRGFIFDVDGVLKHGETAFPGARETLRFIEREGGQVALLTNNATKSRRALSIRLKKMGFAVPASRIVTSSVSAAQIILEKNGPSRCFAVGESGLEEELKRAGHEILPISQSARAEFVVAGLDRKFTYGKLAAAQKAILSGARFIACNLDRKYPVEGGGFLPGSGSIAASIAAASDAKPEEVAGKPGTRMLELALGAISLSRRDVLVVGDGIHTDIPMAKREKAACALVLTGVSTRAQALALPKKERPDFILKDVNELASRW
jgi:HAD superfamily hydrolase (TIGR01450 family)